MVVVWFALVFFFLQALNTKEHKKAQDLQRWLQGSLPAIGENPWFFLKNNRLEANQKVVVKAACQRAYKGLPLAFSLKIFLKKIKKIQNLLQKKHQVLQIIALRHQTLGFLYLAYYLFYMWDKNKSVPLFNLSAFFCSSVLGFAFLVKIYPTPWSWSGGISKSFEQKTKGFFSEEVSTPFVDDFLEGESERKDRLKLEFFSNFIPVFEMIYYLISFGFLLNHQVQNFMVAFLSKQ